MNIKIPVSWLHDYLKTDAATKTVANLLSLSGPSVERIQKVKNDYVLEVEVTSNRVDAYSVFGLARETHAILAQNDIKSQLVPPPGLSLKLDPDSKAQAILEVLIKNPSLCRRFTAIVVDNVKIGPSPAYIKNRLALAGIRPINNIVDMSNYLMLELGQPMHTYDFDKIKKSKMIMREAEEGERITTLDGVTRKVPKGTIVMEDGDGRLIDLCGIMGGENTQISSRTKKVLLYVQSYDPVRIRKTTQALAFRTEAAAIFEKGVDIESIPQALSRSVYLAKQIAGARIASELIDIENKKPQPKSANLNFKKLNDYLGIDFEPAKAAKILELLGFKVSTTPQTLSAQIPSWRKADVESQEDLIEEIARIYGYQNIPQKLPAGQIQETQESDLEKVITLKSSLKDLGLTEIISYSIISKDFLNLTGVKDPVELTNPLTEEWQFMRPTILISLVEAVAKNQYLKSNIKLFEVAKTYIKQEGDLPKQDLHLSIVLQGSDSAEQNFAFYGIKGIVENVFELLGRNPSFENLKGQNALLDKDQSAQIKVGDKIVGTLGMINSTITDHFTLEENVAAAEVNLSAIYNLPSTKRTYHPIPKYPPVIEDISAIFDLNTPIAEIISAVKKPSNLVSRVEIIDIFQSDKIGSSKKSVTLHLTYQKPDSTPTREEVGNIREKTVAHLEKALKAQVRR